jgi:cytosine/adenosine deaminase-related metal-dependent hydrolase
MSSTYRPARLLIRGGRVYDHDGDIHAPAIRDILVEGALIASVTSPEEDRAAKDAMADDPGTAVIDASDLLVIPGFVNAHYHSYDVLAKGMLEDMPFDVWALHSQPAYLGARSKAELRARVLVGALECLRNGITTVQDMNSLVPQNEEVLNTILAAYAEVGIRVVFSIAVRDIAALDIAPFLPDNIPESAMALIRGKPGDPVADLAFVERQLQQLRPLPALLSWALSPSGPQRSSRTLLEGISDLATRYELPIFTHVYETKAQTAKARTLYADQGGSMIRYMGEVGLLSHRTTIAHGVWLLPEELEIMAAHGTGLVHNPISNLKLKSGVAPMRRVLECGINVALGCDNCSCGDCQNMFQAMKMLCLLAAVTDANPTGVHAATAMRAATLGGAHAAGLEGKIGAIRPGMQADLALLDLTDIAYQPFNSAARQMVFSECGRGVRTTIVGGRVVMRDGRIMTVDEAAFRAELTDIMTGFRRDFAAIAKTNEAVIPYLLEANRRVAAHDVGLNRFLSYPG